VLAAVVGFPPPLATLQMASLQMRQAQPWPQGPADCRAAFNASLPATAQAASSC
jgi:hypothetical protein